MFLGMKNETPEEIVPDYEMRLVEEGESSIAE